MDYNGSLESKNSVCALYFTNAVLYMSFIQAVYLVLNSYMYETINIFYLGQYSSRDRFAFHLYIEPTIKEHFYINNRH